MIRSSSWIPWVLQLSNSAEHCELLQWLVIQVEKGVRR